MTADDYTKLAKRCRNFMLGTKRLYDGKRLSHVKGDIWFFELYQHLGDCAAAFDEAMATTMPKLDCSDMPFHPPPDPKS